jgi:surface protein
VTCKQNLCPLCINNHNDKHKIIDYDEKNFICNIHNDTFTSYCKECRLNLCKSCEKQHNKSHQIILYQNIFQNEEEITEKMNKFRKSIDIFNTDIREMIKILNKVKEKVENYYQINYDIVNNYDTLNKNYYILQNISDIKYNIELNDINEIINDDDMNNKFEKILNLYSKMNDKNTYCNEIKMKYKIDKIDKKIKLFDKNFINNNKNYCKYIYDNKTYELNEYFNISEHNEKNNILDISLIGIKNVTNMKYMFFECPSLISISGLNKINTSNVIDMSYIFYG